MNVSFLTGSTDESYFRSQVPLLPVARVATPGDVPPAELNYGISRAEVKPKPLQMASYRDGCSHFLVNPATSSPAEPTKYLVTDPSKGFGRFMLDGKPASRCGKRAASEVTASVTGKSVDKSQCYGHFTMKRDQENKQESPAPRK